MIGLDRRIKSISSNIFMCAILLALLEIVRASNNATNRYMVLDEEQLMKGRFIRGGGGAGGGRKPKFLTFQTVDNDISVEMQLSVPFLTIPIKKTMDTTTNMFNKLNGANLNLGAVGLAGAVVLGSAFILPNVLRLFSADHINSGHGMFGRALEDGGEWAQLIEKQLSAQGAPPRECAGRVLCSLVKQSVDATVKGSPDSSDKIIDGLASNEWIQAMLHNTIFQEAIVFGYSGYDCSSKFSECKLSQKTFQSFVRNISTKMLNT